MQLTLAHIGTRSGKTDPMAALTASYLERCSAYCPCTAQAFQGEPALLDWISRRAGRTTPSLAVFDSSGRQLSSESFAQWLGTTRDSGVQHLVLAIGPASGWSDATRKRANIVLSLGAWTLPHALARLVVAEQLYRAFTILGGHPYHCGH